MTVETPNTPQIEADQAAKIRKDFERPGEAMVSLRSVVGQGRPAPERSGMNEIR